MMVSGGIKIACGQGRRYACHCWGHGITCRQGVSSQGIQLRHELVEAVQLMLQGRLEGLPYRASAARHLLFLGMDLCLPAVICRPLGMPQLPKRVLITPTSYHNFIMPKLRHWVTIGLFGLKTNLLVRDDATFWS